MNLSHEIERCERKPLAVVLELIIEDESWQGLLPQQDDLQNIIDQTLGIVDWSEITARELPIHQTHAGKMTMALVFSDDERVAEMNTTYRHKSGPTNVLSFPSHPTDLIAMEGELPHLGDVVLARQTLLREAQVQQINLQHHLAHLVIHGLLHILGYDHETDEDAEQMEQIESRAMTELGFANPYKND